MLFNSLQFIAFLLIITSLYYVLPHRFRWQILLFGSCYFYMAFIPVYILILGFTIVVDYFAGIWIEQSRGRARRLWLIASLIANIGVLSVFKYYNFLNENLTALLSNSNYPNPLPYLTILLPIGLSFHTFQAMSYTIEVYRGNQKAERHFGIYALYVMFYPQLVAGPIERPQNVLWQFRREHPFHVENIVEGMKLILWGLFKKVVIADRLALMVNFVYSDPKGFEGLPLILTTIAFAFQIYCDFSGYSDIALGTARTLGFTLMQNFDRPYFSTSISEFWKRWHISLSTWFRDYLYIPLGGNRVKLHRLYINLFITFLVSGLWHGANWTYVIWGSLNGFYLIIENLLKPVSIRVPPVIRTMMGWMLTFSLICVAWIFFRAKTVGDAWYILTHLLNVEGSLAVVTETSLGTTKYEWLIAILSLCLLFIVEYSRSKSVWWQWLNNRREGVKLAGFYALAILIILFGVFNVEEQFIYFQF